MSAIKVVAPREELYKHQEMKESKMSKRKRIPEEFGSARELITGTVPVTDFTAVAVLPGTSGIQALHPSEHVLPHFYELYKALVLSYEVEPPAGEGWIDVGDKVPLTVSVSNTYPLYSGFPQFVKPLIKVWFKDVWIRVRGTTYAKVVNPVQWNMYGLVTGTARLRPGRTVEKEITLEILAEVSGDVDPIERIANISVSAALDVEALFSYKKGISAYTQVRPEQEP